MVILAQHAAERKRPTQRIQVGPRVVEGATPSCPPRGGQHTGRERVERRRSIRESKGGAHLDLVFKLFFDVILGNVAGISDRLSFHVHTAHALTLHCTLRSTFYSPHASIVHSTSVCVFVCLRSLGRVILSACMCLSGTASILSVYLCLFLALRLSVCVAVCRCIHRRRLYQPKRRRVVSSCQNADPANKGRELGGQWTARKVRFASLKTRCCDGSRS